MGGNRPRSARVPRGATVVAPDADGAGTDEGATVTTTPPSLSTANRVGLGLAAFLGLADCTALAFPTPEGEVGPPTGILVLDLVLGVITLAAVAVAWRTGRRGALRVAAAARVLSAVTALPAFFVDVEASVVLLVAVFVALTIATVLLLLAPARRAAPVTD